MTTAVRTLIVLALYVLPPVALPLRTQAGTHGIARADSSGAGAALRVFVDCGDAACDPDYLRTELSFVSYV